MKLKVKRVSVYDIGPLSAMVKALYDEAEINYPEIDDNEVEKLMMLVLSNVGNTEAIHLIAYDGKQPVGFFIGNVAGHAFGKPERIGIAHELYVVPEKRGKDVGMKLIRTAVEIALEHGVNGFEAVGTYNGTDQRWIKLGFKPYISQMYMSRDECVNLFARSKPTEKETVKETV